MHLSRITAELAKGDQCSLQDCQEDEAEIVDFIVNNPISLIRNLLAFSKLVFSHVPAVHIELVQNLNKMADLLPNKNPSHQSVAIQRPTHVYPFSSEEIVWFLLITSEGLIKTLDRTDKH